MRTQLLFFLAAALAVQGGLPWSCDFASHSPALKLLGTAKIENGALSLDGRGSYAVIPDSADFHPGESGLTLALVARLDGGDRSQATQDSLDMLCSKGREYIFAHQSGKLYFNFHDGNSWCATTMGGRAPQAGVWAHFAAVMEHFDDPAQGEAGYIIRIYLNGELAIARRFQGVKPLRTDSPVELGRGFGGGPWFMEGRIANAELHDRPLSPAEIASLAGKSPLVKGLLRPGFNEVPQSVKDMAIPLQANASFPQNWVLDCLARASSTGADQADVLAALKWTAAILEREDVGAFTIAFNAGPHPFRIRLDESLAALVQTGKGRGGHPLRGLLDLKRRREILGESALGWEMTWKDEAGEHRLRNFDDGCVWNATLEGKRLAVHWTVETAGLSATADSSLTLAHARLESDFRVENHTPAAILQEVTYPKLNIRKLSSGRDWLVHPWMCGVLVANPTEEQFRYGQEGTFPSGRVSMQFGAYYDDGGGLYFGMEDPLARTRHYSVVGRHGELEVAWRTPVAYGEKGGNGFDLGAVAALEPFCGQWHEAGRIYRRFLERKASWWVHDLPRLSTPQWFRENTLWLLHFTSDRQSAEDLCDTAAYLHEYFGLPFGVHWYLWSEDSRLGWPHFPPKDFTAETNRRLREAGLFTMPYIDSRLWRMDADTAETTLPWLPMGKRNACIAADGTIPTETYGKDNRYAVMCPGMGEWRDVLETLVARVVGYGFSAVYHDQVATARPILCHARPHGHPLNDPCLWLQGGYWPLFQRLRDTIPGLAHTTEEASDPYLKCFDGYLGWRWTDPEQIPPFQSIYAGRVQFVGRIYNHHVPGDPQSFFSKLGQQLVNAEQLGWFTLAEMRRADERRLFVKKAMHVRKALLPWFNAGEMLAPVDFGGTMPMEGCKWGGVVPHVVRMPAIASSAWKGQDGSRLWLFVNTTDQERAAQPVIQARQGLWLCREGAAQPAHSLAAPVVNLRPRTVEVWLEGRQEAAETLQATLRAIAGFDAGRPAWPRTSFPSSHAQALPGHAYTAGSAVGLVGCTLAQDKSHVGHLAAGAVIAFGKLDFGTRKVSSLDLTCAVSPQYSGGTVELLDGERAIACLVLESTGGWNDYRAFTMALPTPLSGTIDLRFRFLENAACNFKSWSFQ
ncbi:MAG: carbohydrate-binding protein [Victivallales bacterium]|nr:carbohydrate-binding protein [Victivallales bacterium]